jgi:carbon monoxide dehydrogenase subunit G
VLLEGTSVIEGAPPERVFAALADPGVLARVVPGCRELVDRGDGVYDLTIAAGVGSIRGTYAGQVQVEEARAPELYAASLRASGSPGTVQATLRAELSPSDGDTTVDYTMDAQLAGPIAGVGQRVVAGVSKRNAEDFFIALGRELSAGPAAEEPLAAQPGVVHPGGQAVRTIKPELTWFLGGLAVGGLLTAVGVRLGRRR